MRYVLALAAMLLQGCLCTWVDTEDLTVVRVGVFNDTRIDNASLTWGGASIGVGAYASKADAASIKATGDAIMNGLMAYGTLGASEATRALVMATLRQASTNEVVR